MFSESWRAGNTPSPYVLRARNAVILKPFVALQSIANQTRTELMQ